jgi:hypothetical protein
MLKVFITAGCLCAANVAGAQTAGLSGHQIRDLIAGAAVEIDTPLGTKLPIHYAADGRLSGQARELATYLGSSADTGRWWINSDQLCHKWTRWFGSEPQCMRLRKEGRTIHWLNQDGNSGTAVITVPAPVVAVAVEPKMHVAAPQSPPMGADAVEPRAQARELQNPAADQPLVAPLPVVAPVSQQRSLHSNTPSLPQTGEFNKRPAGPLYMVANVEQDDVLNVRSGPSTDFDIVAELQPGSRGVAITGACRSQWCPVQHALTRGWVNRMYLTDEVSSSRPASIEDLLAAGGAAHTPPAELRDPPDAPRSCLTPPARALLERLEEKFGPVKLVSTCRAGATIAGTGRPSKHASGNAIDFDAGRRKEQIVEWLIANHHDGGTMTYPDMDHIHIDIGPHFVSIAGGRHWASWRDNQ